MKIADLNIPNIYFVVEKKATVGDTFKTHAKAFGTRFLNKHLHNLGQLVGGGHEAEGRLATRHMTDELMKDWLNYKGLTGKKATRGNVFQFLRRNFSGHLDDHFLRSITGMPTKSQSQAQQPNQTQQQPAAANHANPADQQKPPTSQQTSTAAAPAAPPAAAPPAKEVPYSRQVAATLKGIFDHIYDLYHPEGLARKTVRPPPNLARESWSPRIKLREAEETITDLLKQMLAIGRNGDDETREAVANYIAELKKRRFTRGVPEIQSVPRGAEMFDPSFVPSSGDNAEPQPPATPEQPQPPPQAPTPPAASASAEPQPQAAQPPTDGAAQPAAQPGVPLMITSQMKIKLAGLGYTPEKIMHMTPEQAHEVIEQGLKKAPKNIMIDPTLQRFSQLMQQPQVNSSVMMSVLAKILHRVEGTPAQQKVMDYIKSLQADPNMVSKLPQIGQITLESRKVFEAEDVTQEDLSRSELDHMFTLISQKLADQDDDHIRPPSGSQGNTGKTDNASVDDEFAAATRKRLSANGLQKVLAKNQVTGRDKDTLDKIQQFLSTRPDRVEIGRLERSMYADHNDIAKRLTPDVKSILVKAGDVV